MILFHVVRILFTPLPLFNPFPKHYFLQQANRGELGKGSGLKVVLTPYRKKTRDTLGFREGTQYVN